MKKLLTLLTLLVSFAAANAKCDWSTLKLQQMNDRNYYKWYVSGKVLDDTCVDYMFMIYDFQTKKIDTVSSFRGVCEVEFNKKGKYKMYLKVWNKCLKCDTSLYREVNIIYFPNCKFIYDLKSTNGTTCKDSMVGEMTLGPWAKGDTCWEWYSYMWNGPLLDSLSQHDWDSMSEWQLWNYYDFNDSDLVHYAGPSISARIIKYKFPHDGHYLVATQWYNKCLNQDTFFFTRITIDCKTVKTKFPLPPTSSIKVSPNPADDKVIFSVASTNKVAYNTYEIYDSKGKLVMSGSMGASICVGVGNLPNGVYIVKIGKLTQKFLVQH